MDYVIAHGSDGKLQFFLFSAKSTNLPARNVFLKILYITTKTIRINMIFTKSSVLFSKQIIALQIMMLFVIALFLF